VVLGEGMLKGLEAIYMQPDGELRHGAGGAA